MPNPVPQSPSTEKIRLRIPKTVAEVGRGNRDGARGLLEAAYKSGMRGPGINALARALSQVVPGQQ